MNIPDGAFMDNGPKLICEQRDLGDWDIWLDESGERKSFRDVADCSKFGGCGGAAPWAYEGAGPRIFSQIILSHWFNKPVGGEQVEAFYNQFLRYMDRVGGIISRNSVSCWLDDVHKRPEKVSSDREEYSVEELLNWFALRASCCLQWTDSGEWECNGKGELQKKVVWNIQISGESLNIEETGKSTREVVIRALDESGIQLQRRRLPTFDEERMAAAKP